MKCPAGQKKAIICQFLSAVSWARHGIVITYYLDTGQISLTNNNLLTEFEPFGSEEKKHLVFSMLSYSTVDGEFKNTGW